MIITIGRTYGSGGKEIGRLLARRLEIPCYIADGPGISDQARMDAIRMFAEQGACVIVGFCADHLLAGTPGLIRVFLHCDTDCRVRRIMQNKHITEEEAHHLALCRDRERAMSYGYHTRAKWADPFRYDLVVDTGPLGAEDTVELLCQFVALKVMGKRPVLGPSEPGKELQV